MAGRINDEDVRALRERANIATVVGEYTALKRTGSTLKGLCPFHSEKTPSFTVDPARGLYHCFGCGEGGDIYGFLQRIEALTFPEAVERLARAEGYALRYEELSPGQRRALGRRTRLVEAVAEAAAFFARQLAGSDGEAARRYLAGRGLAAEHLEHFRIGWAPDAWDSLTRHLLARDFQPRELVDAGLATEGRRGPVDRFRARVMFPIFERGGRDIVGFGGRLLPGVQPTTGPRDGNAPKYINSPETEIYHKSEVLYGLNWARAEIQRRDTAVVVEGYMDVIGLHVAGVRHAVATCGTALTAEHFRQLERFARRVVLALDADDAGFNAADRARDIAQDAGIRELGVLPLPPGRDPADLAADGPEAVETALDKVKTAVEFQIEHLLRGADVSTPEGQVEAYRRTFPLLARLPDRFLRYAYIRDLVAPAVRLSADLVERELDAHLAGRGAVRPAAAAAGTPVDATPPSARPTPSAQRAPDPQLQLEREVLRAALQAPEALPPEWKRVAEDDFTAPVSRELFAALRDAPSGDLDAVLAGLPDDDTRTRVRGLALSDTTVEPDRAHVAELVARLRAVSLKREIDALRAELSRLNPNTDPTRARGLLTEVVDLDRRRRALLEGRDA